MAVVKASYQPVYASIRDAEELIQKYMQENKITHYFNCKRCGAAGQKDICEYCGSADEVDE